MFRVGLLVVVLLFVGLLGNVDAITNEQLLELVVSKVTQMEEALTTEIQQLRDEIWNLKATSATQTELTVITSHVNEMKSHVQATETGLEAVTSHMHLMRGHVKATELGLNNVIGLVKETETQLKDEIRNVTATGVTKSYLRGEINHSAEKLRKDQDEWKENIFLKHQHDANGDVFISPDNFIRVQVTASSLSTNNYNGNAADATDGDTSTRAQTDKELTPWYKADLGRRFTGIQLHIQGYSWVDTGAVAVYIMDNDVETQCSTRVVKSDYRWTVSCPNAGDGFKITATASKTEPIVLALYEITVDILTENLITVNVASSSLSTYRWGGPAYLATDGSMDTRAQSEDERTPVYKAKLDRRFTGIKLDIQGYSWDNGFVAVYTTDNDVETECSWRDVRGTYRWVVSCPNAGDGFKITATASNTDNHNKYTITLCLYEITGDILT